MLLFELFCFQMIFCTIKSFFFGHFYTKFHFIFTISVHTDTHTHQTIHICIKTTYVGLVLYSQQFRFMLIFVYQTHFSCFPFIYIHTKFYVFFCHLTNSKYTHRHTYIFDTHAQTHTHKTQNLVSKNNLTNL